MKCTHCQKQHPPYETYCSTTGKLIDDSVSQKFTYETMDFCVSCGESNAADALRCSKCGTETVKAIQKKIRVDKLIDQGLTAIPNIKNNVNLEKSKTTVKEASLEYTQYIKKTPLILLPIAIPIALILLVTALFVGKIKDNWDLLSDFLDLDGLNIFDADLLSASLAAELGINVNVPSFPVFTTLISLMHNLNYSLIIKISEDGYTDVIKMQESNVLLGLLIIPIIALVIGAVIYGWMARKYQWHFWRGIVYSTVIYTLFLTVVAFIARYKVKVSGTDDMYAYLVQFNANITPSLINAVITGAVLTTVIFTFFGYITYAGKQIIEKLETELIYFKYAMYALAVTTVGLVLHLIHALIAVKSSVNDVATDFYSRMIMETLPESAFTITAVYAAVVNWYLSLLGNFKLVSSESKESSFEYTWFLKDSLYEQEIQSLVDMTTLVPPLILMVLSFVIVGALGFLLTQHQLLDWKQAAIIAAFFTVIQLVMLYFVNVKITFAEGSDGGVITATIAVIRQLFTTALFSFAAILAGSYAKVKVFVKK